MTTEPVAHWLETQLHASVARMDGLARDVATLQSALAAREREVTELREHLAIVEGRSRRIESAQEAWHDLPQALAALDARLNDEGELRRALGVALDRVRERQQQSQEAIEGALASMDRRLDGAEQALAVVSARQVQLASDLAGRAQDETRDIGRLAALSDEVAALRQAMRREDGSGPRTEDAVAALQLAVHVITGSTQQLQLHQQRLQDELTTLHRIAEREDALAEVLEQQRTLRRHLEERLALLDSRGASADAAQASEAESVSLLRRRIDRLETSVSALGPGAEAQLEALLDHFRRATIASEAAGRRQTEEIDRQARAARALLVRLSESAELATKEQPL